MVNVVYERIMLLSNASCNGSQSSLLDCSFNTPSSFCDKCDIAGMTCEGHAHLFFLNCPVVECKYGVPNSYLNQLRVNISIFYT